MQARLLEICGDASIWKNSMTELESLTRAHLKTPKAAAIAGIVFSILIDHLICHFEAIDSA